jgi:hypothetical protein
MLAIPIWVITATVCTIAYIWNVSDNVTLTVGIIGSVLGFLVFLGSDN